MDFVPLLPLLPPLIALILILITRQAALSLAAAVVTGVLLLNGGNPLASLKNLLEDIIFPLFMDPWYISAILFTLTLGAFATVLEKSGGFTALLHRLLNSETKAPKKRLLFGIYGLGLLCFFDGLANAILLGRISRPLTDALKISRQFLAYLIDSTSACVACVAFISTWIATQLSLIKEGLKDSGVEESPVSLFFSSIPANPYCLLTLLLIPLVIAKSWQPGPMGKAKPVEIPEASVKGDDFKVRNALIPLAALVIVLPTFIYHWQDTFYSEAGLPLPWSWQNAFSSEGVPYAMTAAGFVALIVACLCFPGKRRHELGKHMVDGAASLLPALIILIFAWSLGSVLKALGTADMLSEFMKGFISLSYLPLAVFVLGAVMSFMTGTSWGTMGLLMPMVLPIALGLGDSAEMVTVLPMVIGAVFGGAVFGDHCSPFSDTTIVSAMASGCSPTSHVITQLPYALFTAVGAALAYTLMALGVTSGLATLISAGLMAALVLTRKESSSADEITDASKAGLE
ncbi:MAG: Na+/H+ antiporter NhaC family protein [Akkermansiaceae bacterium]